MTAKIKPDVLQALSDWNAGKPVRSLELGHSHRMKESREPTAQPQVDFEHFLHRDQERAHAFCFLLIQWGATDTINSPFLVDREDAHAAFTGMSAEFAKNEGWEDLTPEERVGAESLAWKALRVGWKRAIAGHDESMYIEVTNPTVQASAT
jgi:hypothetical protein